MSNVLITGAGSGIGRHLAIKLSKTGKVILVGRTKETLKETADQCKGEALIFPCDIREPHHRETLVIATLLNKVTRVFLSAGTRTNTGIDLSTAHGTIALASSLLPLISVNGGGLLAHLNSVAGKNSPGLDELYYGASKHAITGAMKVLREQGRRINPRVAVMDIFLGAVKTPMTSGRADHAYLMSPSEVTDVIASLCKLYTPSLQVEELHLGRMQFPESRA